MPDSPIRMGGGSASVVPPMSGARRSGRGMQPAGGIRLVVERNAGAVSLSADAEVFSPEAVPSGGAPIGEGPDCYGAHGHPRGMVGQVFGRKYAVGLTTAVAGEISRDVFAGAVDLAIHELRFRPLPRSNSRPLLRRGPWPMMLRGLPQVSVYTGQRIEHSDDSGEWQDSWQRHTDDRDTPVGVGPGRQESSQEAGEAIVVRAIGSAAP